MGNRVQCLHTWGYCLQGWPVKKGIPPTSFGMPVSSGIEFQGSLWYVNVCTYWEVHTLLNKVHTVKISTRHDYL